MKLESHFFPFLGLFLGSNVFFPANKTNPCLAGDVTVLTNRIESFFFNKIISIPTVVTKGSLAFFVVWLLNGGMAVQISTNPYQKENVNFRFIIIFLIKIYPPLIFFLPMITFWNELVTS